MKLTEFENGVAQVTGGVRDVATVDLGVRSGEPGGRRA
jgi:hypothetical protein